MQMLQTWDSVPPMLHLSEGLHHSSTISNMGYNNNIALAELTTLQMVQMSRGPPLVQFSTLETVKFRFVSPNGTT